MIFSTALLITIPDDLDGGPTEPPRQHPLGLTTSIGRADDNTLIVANASVSRQHAMLEATVHGYIVRDLHSQNGTYVNGERVDTQSLRDGDEVAFGEARYVFRASPAGAASAAS